MFYGFRVFGVLDHRLRVRGFWGFRVSGFKRFEIKLEVLALEGLVVYKKIVHRRGCDMQTVREREPVGRGFGDVITLGHCDPLLHC